MSKKIRIMMAVMVIGMALVVMTACNGAERLTPMEQMQQRYNNIGAAQVIEQELTIMRGEMLQYESEKTFEKKGMGFMNSGYEVSGTWRKLNGLDADEAYTEAAIEPYEVKGTTNAIPTLKLDAKYFEQGYEVTETKLTATVKQGNIKDVFGLTDAELAAPTDGLELELSGVASQLTAIRIKYMSNGSSVMIVLKLTY